MQDLLICIITVSVTLILGIIGFVFNSFLQRKNNSIEIITKKRLERRDKLQALSSKILAITDILYLEQLDNDSLLRYVEEITRITADFRAQLDFAFERDAEIVSSVYELENKTIDWLKRRLDNCCVNCKSICEARSNFSRLSDLYISTEWQRIKIETTEKSKRGVKGYYSWKDLYEKNNMLFQNNAELHNNVYIGSYNCHDDGR